MVPEFMIVKNNPNVLHWDMENGYESEVCDMEYPIRIFNSRPQSGLTLYVQVLEKNLEYLCRG